MGTKGWELHDKNDPCREAQKPTPPPRERNKQQILELCLTNCCFSHVRFSTSSSERGRLTLSCWRFALYCLSCSSSCFRACSRTCCSFSRGTGASVEPEVGKWPFRNSQCTRVQRTNQNGSLAVLCFITDTI